MLLIILLLTFAIIIKNPAIRNLFCIILYGDEGGGKNRLFDIFKTVIADKYANCHIYVLLF